MDKPWVPQPGFQEDALDARYIVDELFGGGDRGGGKSDWLLQDYASDVEEWGKAWKGIIFRKTMSQFISLIDRSKELFYAQFPGSRFFESKDNLHWRFNNGATLRFFYMKEEADADKHQGLDYTFIGWEELPLFPSQRPYHKLKATLRSNVLGIPKRIRSTGNPGGPGLGWIKEYFKIPQDPIHKGGEIFVGEDGKTRMFLRSTFRENLKMLAATPDYEATLISATQGNPELAKAWIHGDFNVFFGRFFEVFSPEIHRIDPLTALPGGKVPNHWRLYGCLDYGESSPTAFGLVAVDEHGTAYLIMEYYKSGLWVSEHCGNIKSMLVGCPYTDGRFPERVFADGAIFHTRAAAGKGQMNKMVSDIFKAEAGLKVVPSNKHRISGWRYLKEQMAWKKTNNGTWLRTPRFYYFPECENFEREADNAVYGGKEGNPKEDLDSNMEDHLLDAVRYFVMGAMKARPDSVDDLESIQTFKTAVEAKKRDKRVSFYVPSPSNLVNFDDLCVSGEDMWKRDRGEKGKILDITEFST
jgi:hypothetical protein